MNSPLAWAAGSALLHSLWQGAIAALVLAVIVAATRSARVRYVAACAALLSTALCFGLTLLHLLPIDMRSATSAKIPALVTWAAPAVPEAFSRPDLAAFVPWLAVLWIAGVCVFYARHVAGWISVSRLRRRGVCSAADVWQQRLACLSAGLRVTRPVQLLESCLVEAPLVLGHFRPIILMPVGLLTGLPVSQVEAILMHELAHVRRHDYLVNVLQRFVEGLMFYHPAVWWISHVICAERENCCDDLAVAMSGNAHEYASALALLEVNRQSSRQPALAATGGSLVKRIQRLLYPKRPAGLGAPLLALILLATATVGLTAWQSGPLKADSPYMKWMNQDVVYIISAQERSAFQKLTTDEERTQFIKEFWERRDPTPGTERNEFKEEHYRRIAYANDRFAAPVLAGWQTDRGHMYIIYGPPDEIESHPTKTPTSFAHEQWLYRHLDGIGDRVILEFVDSAGNGDYRMSRDPRAAR